MSETRREKRINFFSGRFSVTDRAESGRLLDEPGRIFTLEREEGTDERTNERPSNWNFPGELESRD